MKESEKILGECNELIAELNKCMLEEGWKARYLGRCNKYIHRISQCRLKLHEQQRLENRRLKKDQQAGPT